jgi:transposase
MKKPAQHLIAEVPCRQARVEITIGIDLGDVWSHYCTLNIDGVIVDRGRFRTTPKAIEKWRTDVPHARVAMEAGVHSIWISEQLQELGHEVIVANVRELRAISHSDRKSDQVDAEKLARYARLDLNILRPIAHRIVQQQEALTLIRARALLVRLRTAAVNAVRGLTKVCGYRMSASATTCFAQRSLAVMPSGLADRGDDAEDQATQPADPAARPDRVSGDTSPAEGSRRRPPHRPNLRADARQQGTVRTKSRCVLLPGPTATTKSVRRPSSSAWYNPRRQRLSSKPADRVLQPHPPTAWKDSALRQWGLHLAARGGKQAKSKAVVASSRQAGHSTPSPLSLLWSEWRDLEQQIIAMNAEVEQIASSDPVCQGLRQITGVGPLVATAIVTVIGSGAVSHKWSVFFLACATTALDQWQGPILRHQQARQQLPAQDPRVWCSSVDAEAYSAADLKTQRP